MSQLAHAPPGYEHVRPLGRAAYGESYLAIHTALRREVVVLEIPRSAFVRAGALGRLRREARVLAATSLGSVVRILDLDSRHDPVCVVTERVVGPSLADLIDDGPIPRARALRILEDVAAALQLMAWHQVAHGGVNTDQVVVLPEGRARLRGFGVARALRPTDPDQWSDAYDFAVLAHRTLTGEPPPLSPEHGMSPLPWRAAEALLAGLADRASERPLPHELVDVLRSIPVDDWTPTPGRRRHQHPRPLPRLHPHPRLRLRPRRHPHPWRRRRSRHHGRSPYPRWTVGPNSATSGSGRRRDGSGGSASASDSSSPRALRPRAPTCSSPGR